MVTMNRAQILWHKFRTQDRGAVLLEAILCVVLVGVMANGFLSGSISSTKVQKQATNHSVVAQTIDDQFEAVKAMRWQDIGTAGVGGVHVGDSLISNPVHGGTIASTKTVTVRGLAMTVVTGVGWQKAPVGGASYGQKVIVIKATWEDGHNLPQRTKTTQIRITPGVSEAAPSKVRRS